MARIVVCGAGIVGLTTAMLLAKDGHDVTVLERDPAPPTDPAEAWDHWERRGVGQFRLPHFILPPFRRVMEAELPEVAEALAEGGALRHNVLGPFADVLDPEGRHVVLTARRPIAEAAIASAAERVGGLTIRRGVPVEGLSTEGEPACPRVVGVRTEAGEDVRGDLVVDAGGRRSPLGRWLTEAGARAPEQEEEDAGFVYYGRHVRSPGAVLGPRGEFFGSVGTLVLPADRDMAGIGLTAWSGDADLRALRHEGPWRAVMALLPGGDEILAAEQLGPIVMMAGIEDRWRRFVVDGVPVATGVVSVGDAWAATNPTLGRGMSLGALQAVALRGVVRDVGTDAHEELVLRYDAVTQERFTPWYRSTVWHDRHRLGDLEAAASGAAHPSDELWDRFLTFSGAAFTDLELLPHFLSTFQLERRTEEVLADPAVVARVDAMGGRPAAAGPDRAEVLAAIAAAA